MSLQVVGAGFGRTGTHSLREALGELGLGPCYHMIEVIQDPDRKVPQWVAASQGKPDWDAIFEGYASTVDWPSAGYWKPILAHYPDAKVILTSRSAESWFDSFSETIAWLMATPETLPPQLGPWLKMVTDLIAEDHLRRPADRPGARDCGLQCLRGRREGQRAGGSPAGVPGLGRMGAALPLSRQAVPAIPYPRTNTKDDFVTRFKQRA